MNLGWKQTRWISTRKLNRERPTVRGLRDCWSVTNLWLDAPLRRVLSLSWFCPSWYCTRESRATASLWCPSQSYMHAYYTVIFTSISQDAFPSVPHLWCSPWPTKPLQWPKPRQPESYARSVCPKSPAWLRPDCSGGFLGWFFVPSELEAPAKQRRTFRLAPLFHA